MTYLLEHATALLALGAAAWLTGRALLPRGTAGPYVHVAAFCLGIGYASLAMFLLAAVGLLARPGLLAAVVPLLVVAAIRRLSPVSFGDRSPHPQPLSRGERGGRRWGKRIAAALVLSAFLLPLFALNVSPPVSWDAQVYHLTLPKLYLAEGGFRPVEMSVYSNWPLLIQLLYAVALLLWGYTLAKAVHFGFFALVVLALFAACRRWRLPWTTPWLATAFFLSNGVVLFEVRTAYVDLAHAFLFFAAFLFMEQASLAEGRHGAGSLLSAGLTCGLLAGVKVSGILGVPVIAALYLPRLFAETVAGRGRAAVGRFLLRFALPAVALWAPWLVKSAWYTGNPVYPFLYGAFGGPDWSEELSVHLSAWQRGIGMGRGVTDYLLLPLRVILLGQRGYDRFDGEIGLFWIVLVPLILYAARAGGTVRRAAAAAGLYFLMWAATSQQMRFLIPILPVLAFAGAAAVVDLVERLRAPRQRRIGHGLALLAALALATTAAGPGLAAGARTVVALSHVEGDVRESVVPPYLRFVNEQLPADARILFLNTNLGFFCDREYLADSFFEASQIAAYLTGARTSGEVYDRLRRRGVTHVLLDRRQRPRRIEMPGVLGQMLAERTQVLYRSEDGRYEVRKLR